jgi:C4-dicarboxylate-specific signal transduction histidine kinase
VPVIVAGGPDVAVAADADQLQQLLINLVRNAADASAGIAEPEVRIDWSREGDEVEIRVADRGPGIGNPSNLFVPFFTTKPGGSGIGLVLCRQIAEGHGGSLRLENLPTGGCLARLRLPVAD